MQPHFRHLIIIFVISVCCPTLLFGQQVGFYFEKSRRKASVPFELYNNLIVVSFTLNGTYPLNFILDTGVRPTIIIDKSFTDSIGMQYVREVELYGVGNQRSVKAQVVNEISLSTKKVNSKNLSVLVLEENLLQLEKHLGTSIHGILGYDFFSRFIVKINYHRMRIELFEPSDFISPRAYNSLPLLLTDSKPYLDLHIQQDSSHMFNGRLLVDTGASHALILNPASSPSIDPVGKLLDVNMGRSIAGEIVGKLGRLDRVEFGKFLLDGVIASYIEGEKLPTELDLDKNGSVGGEFLRKFTIIFDYYHQKLYVKPNRSFREPFEYNMSGLEFVAEGKNLNRYIISSIRPGSVSDQIGFEPGDILVSVNNLSVKKLRLSRIYTELSMKEGKKVNLTVFRNGDYISRAIHLKKEI